MNRTKLYGWIIIGLLLSNLVLAWSVLRPHNGPPPHENAPRQIVINRLHFDENQVIKYDKLIKNHQLVTKASFKDIAETKQLLFSSLKDNSNTINEDSLTSRVAHLQQEIQKSDIAHFKAIKQICKPSQLEDFNVLVNDLNKIFFPPKMLGPKEKRGGPPPMH